MNELIGQSNCKLARLDMESCHPFVFTYLCCSCLILFVMVHVHRPLLRFDACRARNTCSRRLYVHRREVLCVQTSLSKVFKYRKLVTAFKSRGGQKVIMLLFAILAV